MTLITKLINHIEYLYFQDNIKTKKKNEVVTTYIERKNIDNESLKKAKSNALIKHLVKIYKMASLIQSVQYRSEKASIDNDFLEYVKFCYQMIIRSLPVQELRQFQEDTFVRYVHGSTSIEGNTLSLGETESLLIDDLTPSNKPITEVVEVHNYKRAKKFLDTYNGDINEQLIKTLHKIIMNNVLDENAKFVEIGKYRNIPRGIRGVKHSRPEQIKQDINDLNNWYEDKIRIKLQPLEIAAIYHHRFEQIHPFHDGNGRVGRALLDLILKRNDFPQIYITKKERSTYLNALHEADYGNFEPLVNLLIARILWTFNKLLIKTEMYSKMKSGKFGEAFGKFADNESYKMFMEQLKMVEDHED